METIVEQAERIAAEDGPPEVKPRNQNTSNNVKVSPAELDEVKDILANPEAVSADHMLHLKNKVEPEPSLPDSELVTEIKTAEPVQSAPRLSPTEQDILQQLQTQAKGLEDYLSSPTYQLMLQNDPQAAATERHNAEQVYQNLNEKARQLHQMAGHNARGQQQENILTVIPAWRDGAVREREANQMLKYYEGRGISAEQIAAQPQRAGQIYSEWKASTRKPRKVPKRIGKKANKISEAFKRRKLGNNPVDDVHRLLDKQGITSL